MRYDYRKGRERVNEILEQPNKNAVRNEVPNNKGFSFENGYHCRIASIFVDIRDSTTLFERKKSTVSKVIRCFTSEVIKILNTGSSVREIGIRGDCVFGVFSTPDDEDIYGIMERATYVNTLMNMLNALFEKKGIAPLKAGIGVATSQALVVKAGRKDSGINSKVWIGDAVVDASNLSSYGNKKGYTDKPIVMSPETYNAIKKTYFEKYGNEMKNWFTYETFDEIPAYVCNIVMNPMGDWINGGMDD